MHASVYDEFVAKLKASFEATAIGDPFADPTPAYSSQIDAAQLEKIDAMVQRAVAAGAEVAHRRQARPTWAPATSTSPP